MIKEKLEDGLSQAIVLIAKTFVNGAAIIGFIIFLIHFFQKTLNYHGMPWLDYYMFGALLYLSLIGLVYVIKDFAE